MTYALDIETEATDPSMKLFAGLQPWRLRQGKARITSIALCDPEDKVIQIENHGQASWVNEVHDLLSTVQGKPVYGHNTVFDVAWMIAQLQPNRMGRVPEVISNIHWRDTSLLCKWLINGQLAETTRFSLALANLVKTFLPNHPMTEYFVQMKANKVAPGDNPEYWARRGEMDAIMTRALAVFFQAKLPESQRTGFLVEQKCIVPVANSWIVGIKIDQAKVRENGAHFSRIKTESAKKLGVDESIFTSTKRLPQMVFQEWGLPVLQKTPSGAPSCGSDTLKWLQYQQLEAGNQEMADKLGLIMEAKSAATMHSKYVKSMIEALEHTGDGYIYPAPRIFGTYTGRMTYSSTTLGRDFSDDKGKKFKVSIAAHQIPRKDKMVRASLVAPDGYEIYEADASGQESRLMALRSNDPLMIEIFAKDMNFHSMTGASIIGMDYTDFQVAFKAEHDGGYYTEQRQLGKLTNLSCNYRISGKTLANKSFTEHDMFMTTETGIFLVNTFNRLYSGVPRYWNEVIEDSRRKGYTDTFGGRRYKLTDWNSHRWITESSAINVPIQGSGADMKEIAIHETFLKVPEAIFVLDLHDASFFYVKKEFADSLHAKIDSVLNEIDYSKYWGIDLAISLPYESKRGATWAHVK